MTQTVPWSKQKARIEALFAPALRGRVALHRTSYRTGYELSARAWITFEGATIWECRSTRVNPADPTPFGKALDPLDVPPLTPHDFDQAIADYPDLTIDEALASTSPIVRALAFLDRRTGKRRLKVLGNPDELVVPVERTLFLTRLRSERIQERSRGGASLDQAHDSSFGGGSEDKRSTR